MLPLYVKNANSNLEIKARARKIIARNFNKLLEKNKAAPLLNLLHEYDLLSLFKTACDQNRQFSQKARNKVDRWIATNNIEITPLQLVKDREAAAITGTSTEEANNDIQTIEGVDVTMVQNIAVPGSPDELLSVEHENVENSTTPEREAQHHLEYALNFLGDHGIRNAKMKVYKENSVEGKMPYALIDVNSPTLKVQILLCDYHFTYVDRDPAPYNPETPIEISALKDKDRVWQFSHQTKDGLPQEALWIKQLEKHVFTPTEKLKRQAKHMVSWPDKGLALKDTMIAQIINIGEKPKVTDGSMTHGPLSAYKDTTWTKANDRLHKKAIPFFKDKEVTSLNKLYNYIATQSPALKSFLHNPLKAVDVLKTVADNIVEGREVGDLSCAFGSVADHSAEEISFALPHLSLQSVDDFIEQDGKTSCGNVVNFAVACGLAVKDGQELIIDPDEAKAVLDLLHDEYGIAA